MSNRAGEYFSGKANEEKEYMAKVSFISSIK